MKKNKQDDIEIIHEDGIPQIKLKSEFEEEVEKIEKLGEEIKRSNRVDHGLLFSGGLFVGIGVGVGIMVLLRYLGYY